MGMYVYIVICLVEKKYVSIYDTHALHDYQSYTNLCETITNDMRHISNI